VGVVAGGAVLVWVDDRVGVAAGTATVQDVNVRSERHKVTIRYVFDNKTTPG
jgi:hypothetical protein